MDDQLGYRLEALRPPLDRAERCRSPIEGADAGCEFSPPFRKSLGSVRQERTGGNNRDLKAMEVACGFDLGFELLRERRHEACS
jgi:hypothetical protein